MLCSANIWLGLKRLDVGAHIPSGVVGGPLNSRPLPMKPLVICILSLPASNPPQLIHAIRSRVRHLAPRCVLRLVVGTMAKGGESYLQMRGLMLFVMKAAMRLISGPSHSHTGTSFSHSHPDLSRKKKRTQMMMRVKMTMVTISRENSGKVAA